MGSSIQSLPPRLAKGMDFPAFNTNPSRSPQRNNDGALSIALPSPQSAFMPRVSNQAIQDNPKNDARPSYRQSPLSYEFSFNKEGSLKAAKSDNEDMGGIKEKDLGSTQLNNDSSQFHFSIYKWASKGVPLVTPLRGLNGSMPKRKGKGESSSSSKEKGDNESNSGSIERGNNESSSSLVDSDKSESMINESSASILQGVGFLLPEERMSTVASSSQMGLEDQKNGSLDGTLTKDRTDSFRISVKLGLKPLDSLESITTEIPGSFVHNAKKEIEPGSGLYGSLSEIGPFQNTEKEINGSAHESCKPELVPLCPLLYENSSGQGTVSEIGAAKANVTSSVNVDDGKILKKHDSKRNIFNIAANSSLQDSSIDSEEKRGGKSVKGKVKEFVKIFSREASSKSTTDIDMQGQISRWKEINTCKAEEKVSNHATKTDGKVNIRNKEKPSTETFFMVDQALKQSENPDIEIDTDIHKFHHTSSERNNSSASLSGFEAALAHMEESHCEYLHGNCLGEDLSLDKSKQQLVEYQEEIQVSDARIQEWSNGKEGNIRSLLSTLQYVLWPESGWKPVPLVDIIEGNAVKRAYQKALLCLHPDKLQQKGVALHKKYIAEKVFDILQEAWNHFNSLGSF
ncbi:PREDICTED: J domain-containing protein required for chloroplast accumulation response 1 isoform X2 [Nelumbo nucifera]|uniref:J domain-containing protein required for chloroplast accumulation response 1 isoform X2 n=1 Tax=Nelumbo nucifera TaxID=4432 RepID=A0A1U7ZSA2_NELNU|nr:PREDICTED: J domain-containing protein required for chloroplast accumulation response 1 isoform X2 [Nelumbo nucifera]